MFDGLLVGYARAPEHPAKYRIVRWLGRWAFPSEGVLVEVSGVRLHLHPRDWLEYFLLSNGAYEPDTLNFLSRNLQPSASSIWAPTKGSLP